MKRELMGMEYGIGLWNTTGVGKRRVSGMYLVSMRIGVTRIGQGAEVVYKISDDE
jgi:hypothetical protein